MLWYVHKTKYLGVGMTALNIGWEFVSEQIQTRDVTFMTIGPTLKIRMAVQPIPQPGFFRRVFYAA